MAGFGSVCVRVSTFVHTKAGIVAPDCPAAWAPTPEHHHHCLAAGLRQEKIRGNNPFLLHVAVQSGQGVKAKVPFPQLLLHHGRDNPHYECRCGTTRDVREPDKG